MKRILLALFFGFVFGTIVFGQQPVNPAPVQMAPLVNFDAVIEQIIESFTDILKEFWVMILSVFFIWVIFMSAMSFLEGRMERWKAEKRMRESVERTLALEDARIEKRERAEAARARLALRMGWDGEVERQLGGYSNDMRSIIRREREHLEDNESIVQIDGAYYVRSETNEGDIVGHKTLEAWRSERDTEESYPFSVRSGSSYREADVDHEDSAIDREESAEREVFSYEEADFERWKEEESDRLWKMYKSDRQRERFEEEYDCDDGFDRDYGSRRSVVGGY